MELGLHGENARSLVSNTNHLPLALGAQQHLGLCKMPVSLAADWTTEALVTLLVAAVTDRVVQVPTRAWSTAWRT